MESSQGRYVRKDGSKGIPADPADPADQFKRTMAGSPASLDAPLSKKRKVSIGSSVKWTPEMDRKLLIFMVERHVPGADFAVIAKTFSQQPTPKSIQDRVYKLRAESRRKLQEHGLGDKEEEGASIIVPENDGSMMLGDTRENVSDAEDDSPIEALDNASGNSTPNMRQARASTTSDRTVSESPVESIPRFPYAPGRKPVPAHTSPSPGLKRKPSEMGKGTREEPRFTIEQEALGEAGDTDHQASTATEGYKNAVSALSSHELSASYNITSTSGTLARATKEIGDRGGKGLQDFTGLSDREVMRLDDTDVSRDKNGGLSDHQLGLLAWIRARPNDLRAFGRGATSPADASTTPAPEPSAATAAVSRGVTTGSSADNAIEVEDDGSESDGL